MNQYVVWFCSLMWAGLTCAFGVLAGYLFVPPLGMTVFRASRGEIHEMAGVGICVYVIAQVVLRQNYWSSSVQRPSVTQEILLLVVIPTIAWIFFPDWPLCMAGVLFLIGFIISYQDSEEPTI